MESNQCENASNNNENKYIINEQDNKMNSYSEKFNTYKKWLKSLSWFKFILFFFLTMIVASFIEDLVLFHTHHGFISTLANIFVFVSLGIKVLSKEESKQL